MSLQGPLLIVSSNAEAELVAALSAAGAFPIIESSWREAASAVKKIKPAAVVLGAAGDADDAGVAKLQKALAALRPPYVPVLARTGSTPAAIAGALPIAADAPPSITLARMTSALRVRALEAAALRRIELLEAEGGEVPTPLAGDPLDEATILVLGRGRGYPELAVAVGECAGLIGALSVETAARYLNARDIDGIVIGDGFGPPVVEAFLIAIAEDVRFRDLPIALTTGAARLDALERLPNLELIGGPPRDVLPRLLPLVRQHAHAGRLERLIASIDAKGRIDPQSGLFTASAFLRELQRAVDEAENRGGVLSIARLSFGERISPRASLDAARLVSRMVRAADFACRSRDGSVLIVFAETNLRTAHVVARRIASVIRQTLLSSEPTEMRIDPSVTLATLKAADTVETLIARIDEPRAVAG